jgi:hypothetical protein
MPRPRRKPPAVHWGSSHITTVVTTFLDVVQRHDLDAAVRVWSCYYPTAPRPDQRAFLRKLLEVWLAQLSKDDSSTSLLDVPGMTPDRLAEVITALIQARDRCSGWSDF